MVILNVGYIVSSIYPVRQCSARIRVIWRIVDTHVEVMDLPNPPANGSTLVRSLPIPRVCRETDVRPARYGHVRLQRVRGYGLYPDR